jgi:protein-disulfide isomerase
MVAVARRSKSAFARMSASALALGVAIATSAPEMAQAKPLRARMDEAIRIYLEKHPEALGPAIEKYLADHPEAVGKAIRALIAKRGAAPTDAVNVNVNVNVNVKQVVADNAKALYSAPLQTVVGAPEGATTLVEFFDFNCGYCRKALTDTLTLIAEDPSLRIVLKEYPILGPDSVEAAKVAIALQMRHPDAAASLEFHRRLLTSRGKVDRAAALAVAGELGFDAAQLEKDAASAEVTEALNQNNRLATALGVHGTPGYVLGDSVIAGAVGVGALKARIAALKKP